STRARDPTDRWYLTRGLDTAFFINKRRRGANCKTFHAAIMAEDGFRGATVFKLLLVVLSVFFSDPLQTANI
ncbi:MAG: hypothetical protein VW405_22340, partial [Rhodospirillaceae bacterium]